MISRLRSNRVAFLVISTLLLATALGRAQLPVVRVGVAMDGPWERYERIRTTFEREITQLLQGEYDVQFPVDKRIQADWTASGVKEAVDRLLADPEVDFVLPLGVLTSNEAARRGPLPKPVIAPYIIRPELQGIPFQIREERLPGGQGVERSHVSGVPNLSYVNVRTDIFREISRFLEIVPFSKLTLLGMKAFSDAIPQLYGNLLRELSSLNLEVTYVPVGDSLEKALEEIPSDTQAVYVAPLLQLPPGDFDRLVEALVERRLPSFSLWGQSEVRGGLLASLSVDKFDVEGDTSRLARRVALNLHRILLGEEPEDLPVDFQPVERLTINMATARAIGVYPSFALLTEAELLNQIRMQASRSLSLSAVVREASRVNLDLAAADRTVQAGLRFVQEARAGLGPQVDISGLGLFIDKDRAESSFGRQGQRQVLGSFGASQLIYSDQVRANYDIERNLQRLREEERNQLLLDIILEASESYLNVLRTKTVERIQRDNLRLTRLNLGLAQARVDLGAAGRGEVFRWESQIATNRKDVIDASAIRNQAEIAVNRILNRPLEEPFLTEETALDDTELVTSFEQIRPYIDSPESFGIFRKFMVEEAFEASPELRQLDAAILAQQRGLLATKRTFYVPTFGVQADITGFRNGGAGSTSPQLPIPGFSSPNNLNWSIGFSASLPIFQGGALRARRSRAEIELDELRLKRDATRDRVEQRIRSILHDARASFAGIELSRDAAEAAHRNLDLVQDAYSEGVVDILRLLDAQNQSLVADLVAANAVFDFLLDLMGVQRGVGKFDYYRSQQERQDFLNRLDTYFTDVGFEIRRP